MKSKLPKPERERVHIAEYTSYGSLLKHEYGQTVGLTEDVVTAVVAVALQKQGFEVRTRGIGQQGPDVEGFSTRENVVVEAKGEGSESSAADQTYQSMMGALGQILIRMGKPSTRYVVALPWNRRYVDLIRRVPQSVRRKLNLQFWLVKPLNEDDDLTGETDYHVGVFSWDVG